MILLIVIRQSNISKTENSFLTRSINRFIFDKNTTVPKPYSKTLISVAPHGILTLGWSYCISSRVFFDTETKWLVAPAMMVLPFVQDIMR